MKILVGVIMSVIYLLSCNTLKQQDGTISARQQHIFSDFDFISMPISNLRIGSSYIDGIGSNGDGVPTEGIIIQKTYNETIISSDKETQSRINASLLHLLGIQTQYTSQNKISIKYSGVEVVGVEDIQSLNPQLGVKYIYQGLRVKDLSFQTHRSITGTIAANINKNVDSLEIVITPIGNVDDISLKGVDLYIAQKLLKVADLNSKILWGDFALNPSNDFGFKSKRNMAKVDFYEVRINNDEVMNCLAKYDYEKSVRVNLTPLAKLYSDDMSNILEIMQFDSLTGKYVDAGVYYNIQTKECLEQDYTISIFNMSAINPIKILESRISFDLSRQNLEFILPTRFIDDKVISDKLVIPKLFFKHYNTITNVKYNLQTNKYDYDLPKVINSQTYILDGYVQIYRSVFEIRIVKP